MGKNINQERKSAHLLYQAAGKFTSGVVIVGALLFGPAGTFSYWNAWLFMGLLFVPMLGLGVVLFKKAPDLLEKRLKSKEHESEQKLVVLLAALVFVAGFVVAALDFRFQWSRLPLWLVVAASVLLVVSYGLYGEVMRENAYLSRTVEIQENQKVVDTGLYGIVRHPMYLTTTLLFLSFPLVLGSAAAFVIFLVYPLLLVKRIDNEEKLLEEGLNGYLEYKQKVRYRMIPFVW